MEQFNCTTIKSGGGHKLLRADQIARLEPGDPATVWSFEYEAPLAQHEIEAGRYATSLGLYGANGAGDYAAIMAAKGLSYAQQLIRKWSRKTEEGADLPVTSENIVTVPTPVLVQFAKEVEGGRVPSAEEYELLKKISGASTKSTSTEEAPSPAMPAEHS